MIKDVNPSNGDFFRYIPDEHLDSEQLKSKKEAYNIGNIKEVPFPVIGRKTVAGSLALGTAPKSSLSQDESVVNSNSMQNNENRMYLTMTLQKERQRLGGPPE